MNGFRRLALGLVLTLFVSGCTSAVGQRVTSLVGNDLQRTEEMSVKYGAPEIAQCAKFLNAALGEGNSLASEPTAGLVSLAVKAYLLKKQGAVAEEAFKKECGAFATGLMLEVLKYGKGIGSRGVF